MKKTQKNRIFLSLLTLLLILATLFSTVSCVRKDTPEEPDPEDPGEEVEAQTNLTIGGKSIINHVIVYPKGRTAMAEDVQSAISSKFDVTLTTATKNPGNGKVICLQIDETMLPLSYGFYTQNRMLTISAPTKELLGEAVELFKTKLNELEGEKVDLSSSFSANVIKTDGEVVSYGAATGEKKMIGGSDKNPLAYAVGETAVFKLAVVCKQKLVSVPYYCVKTWNEATGQEKTEYVDGSAGYIEYRIENFSKPGFFYLNVNACDENQEKLSGILDSSDGYHFLDSVAFGSDQISVTSKPSDFDTYWANIVSAVKKQSTSGMKLKQQTNTQTGFITYYWEQPSGGANKYGSNVASGYLTVPTTASETNKIGLCINFQAHSGDVKAPSPVYKAKTATLIVSPHGVDWEKFQSDLGYQAEQIDKIMVQNSNNFVKNPDYFEYMIKRDLLGARFLVNYFGESGNNYWDGETFVVTGASMGAMQSTAVAAMTKEVTGKDVSLLDISIPWLCDVKGGTQGRRPRSWPQNLEQDGYYDPAVFAPKLTCKVNIYAHLGDHTCPASGIMALYNGITSEKALTFEQNKDHGGGNGGSKYQLSQNPNS